MEKNINIAIDGPSAAGKSTVARMLAQELGFMYVDTGALYRTVAVFLELCGIGPKDIDGIKRLIDDINIDLVYDENGTQRMLLNGRDVTDEIRSPRIAMSSSVISQISFVRAYLLEIQRELALRYNVVMDGRDIGTVILPQADLKIFLDADRETRARRRYNELLNTGTKLSFDEVLRDIQKRDENDLSREISPLKKAEDAIYIDTSHISLEDTVLQINKIIREKLSL